MPDNVKSLNVLQSYGIVQATKFANCIYKQCTFTTHIYVEVNVA